MKIIGGQVNCAPYVPASQHKRIVEAAAGAIGEEYAVLADHGVICCGRAAGSPGKVMPIPDEFVHAERRRFLYKYGTAGDAPEVSS